MIVLQSPENKKNKIRLFKVSRELNVGITTLVDFAQKMGYVVESSPNANISSELYQILLKEFSKKKHQKVQIDEDIKNNNSSEPQKLIIDSINSTKILQSIEDGIIRVNLPPINLSSIYLYTYPLSDIDKLNQYQKYPNKQISFIKKLSKNSPAKGLELLDEYFTSLYKQDIKKNQFVAWAITFYERYGKYEEALKTSIWYLNSNYDITLLTTTLRLCKKLGNNYEPIHEIIQKYHVALGNSKDFQLLHNLVYYYSQEKNQQALNATLIKIEKQAVNSLTIQTILKDIYIYLQRFDDAIRVSQKISLNNSKFSVELKDSSRDSIEKIRENIQTELIKQLIKGFSHELGQPITAIRYTIQYYQRLLAKEFSQEKVMEVFNIILDETSRMDSLIKTLRPITSSNATATTYNLLSLIDERLKAQQAQLLTYDIQVKVQNKGLEVLELKGDLPQMEQVINNLLLNAIDALSVLPTTKPKSITITIQSFDNYFVYLNFADNGIGIPETIKDKIFTAFYSTKSPDKGQGLGLFIVKNLLQSIGGDIQLMTNYIEGACFELKIPRNSKPL